MNKLAIFFATGYEEIEALTVVDICRRCGLTIDMVSVTGERSVTGSHKISVAMDMLFEEMNPAEYDMLILPGGKAGVEGLEAHTGLMEMVDAFYEGEQYVAAICAAPSILGHRGILKGRNACSYPSFESHLEGANVTAGPVEISDHVITSRGMGTSIDFALAIVGQLLGSDVADEMAKTIVYRV
ncbi:MAG: DJ-1/PfpI family protein [Lachnospiraceae bacterium]|nr:DJ-1/PfpI family protein [Lachnospiraceae bacterium]